MSELPAADSTEHLCGLEGDLSVKARPFDARYATTDSIAQRVGREARLLGKSLKDPVDVMARTIWGEARGEGKKGMEAVANVICNRANNPRWWGRSIVQVCLKPWQFSTWNPDDANRRKLLAVTARDKEFWTANEIAEIAVSGELEDITYNADHFHTKHVRPLWSQGVKPVVTIGGHRFFRIELTAVRRRG